jgi:hypothetical protein
LGLALRCNLCEASIVGKAIRQALRMKAKPMTALTHNQRILASITKPIVEAAKPAPKAELEWTQLDPASLSPELRKAYDAYRQAAKAAAVLRTEFEARMTVAIDPLDGEKLAFGYKFGKLSLAIVPADKPKRRTAAVSLADYLASKA